jgi:4-nitrophenyl phosphatase
MTTPILEFHPDFLDKYDNIIFDMDGVLIHGKEFLPGIVDTLNQLQIFHKKKVFFCTNNSTQHRSEFLPWFESAGVILPEKRNNLYTAASTAASSIFNDLFDNIIPETDETKFLLVGQMGLRQEFIDIGLEKNMVTLDMLRNSDSTKHSIDDMKHFTVDAQIKAVVAGLQVDFAWSDCAIAVMIIRENNSLFYVTDRDATFPASHTRQLPGCGSIVNMIEASCGKQAQAMGKPTKYMIDAIRRDHPEDIGIDLSRTLMVGDRLDTDIQFGNSFGMGSLLVFSGVTKKDEYWTDEIIIPCHNPREEFDAEVIVVDDLQTPTSPQSIIDFQDKNLPRPTYCADNITWLLTRGGMKHTE